MPIDYHNWLNRVLKPLGDRRGARVNHQILSRTFASLAYNTGGDLKDIRAQMRHASVNTTANLYTKPIPKSVRTAVEALDRRIRRRGQAKKSSAPGRADRFMPSKARRARSAYRSAIAATKSSGRFE